MLWVGGTGTYAIVVSIYFSIIPIQPQDTIVVSMFFSTLPHPSGSRWVHFTSLGVPIIRIIVYWEGTLNPACFQDPGHVHVAAARDAVAANSPSTATRPVT